MTGSVRPRARAESPDDVPAIRRVLAEAFAGERREPAEQVADAADALAGEVALVDALRAGPAWLPGLSMVVEHDGEVVGYALLSRVTVGDEAGPALALGPVAVLPAVQGQGFGTAVVWAALDAAALRAEQVVVVLGSPDYYGRFGFVPAADLGLTSPWSEYGAYYQALRLPAYPADERRAPRGEVTYPAPWHAF